MSKIALTGNASGTGTFTLASPNSNSNYQLDLPAESGTIVTSVSGLNATNLTSGTIPKARMYAGAVLQVLQTTKTDTFSSSSATWVDITGLSVSITPSSASNKVLIIGVVQAVNGTTTGSVIRLMRDSTAISQATSTGNRQSGSSTELFTGRSDNYFSSVATYLDSPATTSAVTYKIQILPNSYAAYVNRSVADTDSTGYSRGVSYITVMEVAG